MAMQASEIERMIKAAFPDAVVEIKDLAGDGDHYAATVTSAAFKGSHASSSTRWSMPPCKETWAACCMPLR